MKRRGVLNLLDVGAPPEEVRACRDKKVFRTRKEAKAARFTGTGTHIYKCTFCPWFHMTRRANDDGFNGKIDWRGFKRKVK